MSNVARPKKNRRREYPVISFRGSGYFLSVNMPLLTDNLLQDRGRARKRDQSPLRVSYQGGCQSVFFQQTLKGHRFLLLTAVSPGGQVKEQARPLSSPLIRKPVSSVHLLLLLQNIPFNPLSPILFSCHPRHSHRYQSTLLFQTKPKPLSRHRSLEDPQPQFF